MARCEVCHNEYDNSFSITMGGSTHVFDSFECAAHLLAPKCKHCGCRILGHGIEGKDSIYCCANCAREAGLSEARDHV